MRPLQCSREVPQLLRNRIAFHINRFWLNGNSRDKICDCLLWKESYVSNIAVNCPLGTYYSLEHHTCESCWTGAYQDEEGQLECKSCPSGTYTEYLHSRSISECKGEDFVFFKQPLLNAQWHPFGPHDGVIGMRLASETRTSPHCLLQDAWAVSKKSWPMKLCFISAFILWYCKPILQGLIHLK